MKLFIKVVSVITIFSFFTCQTKTSEDMFPGPKDITLSWELISNILDKPGQCEVAFSIKNKGPIELSDKGWNMYFSHLTGSVVKNSEDGPFKVIYHNNL